METLTKKQIKIDSLKKKNKTYLINKILELQKRDDETSSLMIRLSKAIQEAENQSIMVNLKAESHKMIMISLAMALANHLELDKVEFTESDMKETYATYDVKITKDDAGVMSIEHFKRLESENTER